MNFTKKAEEYFCPEDSAMADVVIAVIKEWDSVPMEPLQLYNCVAFEMVNKGYSDSPETVVSTLNEIMRVLFL